MEKQLRETINCETINCVKIMNSVKTCSRDTI